MRILFIIPEMIADDLRAQAIEFVKRVPALRKRMHKLPLVLVATRYEVLHQCYYALGRTKLATGIILVDVGALYLLVPVAFHFFGFVDALWAIALASFASLPLDIWLTFRLGLLDFQKELLVLLAFPVGMAAGTLLISAV